MTTTRTTLSLPSVIALGVAMSIKGARTVELILPQRTYPATTDECVGELVTNYTQRLRRLGLV